MTTTPIRRRGVVSAWLLCLAVLLGGGCASWDGSVGAVFARDNPSGRVFVRDVPPDMGAFQAGVQIGDELLAVDGLPVHGLTADDLHKKLVGKVGSKVKLQVRRAGQVLDCVVQRGPLKGGS